MGVVVEILGEYGVLGLVVVVAEESYIEVALNKASAEVEGPDVIRVGVLFETGSGGQGLVRTTAPVPVHITVESTGQSAE